MKIYLIRHGQSLANTGEVTPNKDMPCNKIPLTPLGVQQAKDIGKEISHFLSSCNIYHSPFVRAKDTIKHLYHSAYGDQHNIDKVSEESVSLREVDVGTGKFHENLKDRANYGWFYYKFPNGESPCEVYDRVATFYNEVVPKALTSGKNILMVSHGMTIRTVIMKALRLTVEEFNSIDNPDNCKLITIGAAAEIDNAVITKNGLAVNGISLRSDRNDYTKSVEM